MRHLPEQAPLLMFCRMLASAVALLLAQSATAGPPFLTDDPEPTERGRWEIYAPAADVSGTGGEFDGSVAAELNYGALPDVQLTLGLPVGYARSGSGLSVGRGDLEVSVKYRFFHDDARHLSVAAFPGLSLPIAGKGLGAGRVTAFLPVWAQQDLGPWSVFGGGGFAINPGRGNRNFWSGGVAISRSLSERLLVGLEADREGPDTVGGHGSTSLGVGFIRTLRAPFRLLASAGPTFRDGERRVGYHGFLALGIDY